MTAAPTPVIPGLERPEAIGRGGFGTVYAADEPAFGRRVAVKILSDRIGDPSARRGFERECQAMGALSGHPHIVAVHRGGATDRGEPYIVMEYMAGGSLADRLARTGPLPWPEVLEIGVLVAGALETAHRAEILHLDVKPANILVSRFAEPVLGDFGISRLPGVTVTLDGRVRATACYSAPERLVEGTAGVRTDLYALGATLFALLAGAPAFAGQPSEEIVATVARVLREAVPDLRARGVPGPVADLVERLMAKDPADRPASAQETATLLQAAQRTLGQPVTRPVIEGSRPPPPPPARARRGGLMIAAQETTTTPPRLADVAVAPGVTHPATADVARVLDTFVSGINDRRYSDAFAVFAPDNPTAKKGLAAWVAAETSTQIHDARIVAVNEGAAGSVNAEMTFTSAQDAALGWGGQSCSRWDLVYDLVGPGPDWKIHLVDTRGDPTPC